MFKPRQAWLSIAPVALALTTQHVKAQIVATIDDPGVEASTAPGVTTETFDEFTPGIYTTLTSSIGTYTSPGMAIVAADQYGGAGGHGNYFAVGNESGYTTATLQLAGGGTGSGTSGEYNYFGFAFEAGDPDNEIQLYQNSTLEYTFSTATLISFINTRPDASDYYGNPNNRSEDPSEPFAYVNFVGTNGTEFNTVVLSVPVVYTGFESDNQSIGVEIPLIGIPIVPEPSIWAMTMTGSLTGVGLLALRKRARR